MNYTLGQLKYINSIRNLSKPITICTGPAGSGKTHIACNESFSLLNSRHFDKIIMTRPTKSVADENLGYLPGDLNSKFEPWILPIIDCIGKSEFNRLQYKDKIEIAPLAYMRGRTFANSIVIADEMQNTSTDQLKMFLTRIGFNSKFVITGDIQQTDIPDSGLAKIIHKLQSLTETSALEYISLDKADIHRHEAIIEILNLFDEQ